MLLQLNGNTDSGDAMTIKCAAYESHIYKVSRTVPIDHFMITPM